MSDPTEPISPSTASDRILIDNIQPVLVLLYGRDTREAAEFTTRLVASLAGTLCGLIGEDLAQAVFNKGIAAYKALKPQGEQGELPQ